ncbi:MAG: hypothetical protein AABZ08_05770 [Planctomycetota bacterium]
MGRPVATIDFNVDDNASSVKLFLARILSASNHAENRAFAIDLSKCKYLGPDAAAILAATLFEARNQNRRIRVTWPSGPKELTKFCDLCGLTEAIKNTPYINKPYDRSQNVLRMRAYHSHSIRDADPVIELVSAHFQSISNDNEDQLRICVNEVVQNMEDHAKSPIGVVMCARFLRRKKQVRVALVDRRLGIHQTLSKRYHDIKDASAALHLVLTGKYSAQSRKNNAGLGINLLKSIVETLGGHLYIITETSMATVGKTKTQVEDLPFRFNGTGVFFSLPVDHD